MSNKVTINKQAILKLFKEEGMKKYDVKKQLYPKIANKHWDQVWDALGLKNTRPEKAFSFDIDEESEPTTNIGNSFTEPNEYKAEKDLTTEL